jgi:uncharacterized protein
MPRPDFESARTYAIERLSNDLDPALVYHCLEHTRDEVTVVSANYAREYGVDEEELLLLKTAACFHDLGFLECREGHEKVSVRIAREVLPDYGYTPEQIDRIAEIIMATQLPQSPNSLLEQIIADADLDVFGREDFIERNRCLRQEMEAFGRQMSDAEWYAAQIRFAQAHEYFTEAARRKNSMRKSQNIAAMEALLEKAEATSG